MQSSGSLRRLIGILGIASLAWGQSNVDFASQVNPIFTAAGCTGCHGSGAGGLTLGSSATANYDALVGVTSSCNGLAYVDPSSTSTSHLYLKITGAQNCGSRMPQGNPSYFDTNTDELALIRVWIEEGALATASTVALQERPGLLPAAYSLGANYPNPFNPSTTITYDLPESGPVTLAVYDLQGRQVAILAQGFRRAGRHSAVWQGRNRAGESVGSGVYLYRLRTDRFTAQGKMVLLK